MLDFSEMAVATACGLRMTCISFQPKWIHIGWRGENVFVGRPRRFVEKGAAAASPIGQSSITLRSRGCGKMTLA
jgi:hypothetical protein